MTQNSRPEQDWWTSAEIADAALPDMPTSRQGVEHIVKRYGWRTYPDLARKRAGRGGGWEYNWKLFPARAQRRLVELALKDDLHVPNVPVKLGRDEAWDYYESLPAKAQAEGARRLAIIQSVEALIGAAVTKHLAVIDVAKITGVSPRTIWNWFTLVEGVSDVDRLAYLAPRHRASARKVQSAEFTEEFFDWLKSDFLRPTAPSFATAYRRAIKIAADKGWIVAPERTMRRRLDAEVPEAVQVLARKGLDALKRMYPAQTRDKTCLRPLQAVNGDFHKFDVFVQWPLQPGEAKPYVGRPQMCAFQDIFSAFVLSWRVDQTPNSEAVRLCAGDMIEDYGIPEQILLDNGREFAAKALTGGAPTRYRFKVREDDIPGLFTNLGCAVHWATPYSGQSKPIERAFRDMCDAIAKDPRFDGAYTGNRPDAKPEDYGSRAIPLEDFLKVLAEGIEEHNTRQGRRSEVAFGRSFAEVFDEAYANTPIRRATEAQRRFWLMGAEGLRGNTRTGLVKFMGNEYYAPWMTEVAGARIIARFDPAALWDGIHIYSAANEYLGHAPCRNKAGFFDVAEGRVLAKARKAYTKAVREQLVTHRKLKAVELGRDLDALSPEMMPEIEAKVVRPVFGKQGRGPDVAPPMSENERIAEAAIVADLSSRRVERAPEEAPRARFKRALELERQIAAGDPATPDQQRWLMSYQKTPEYQAERMIFEDFGDGMFG